MTAVPSIHDPRRFEAALRRFDEQNAADPNRVTVDGAPRPRELVYAEWLTGWLLRLCPEASEELRLAARCQHLCRWLIPRESYPMTRTGYLRWRKALKRFHAERACAILRELGFPEAVVARVQALNLKGGFPKDPESRVLENALCLVFLEKQFADLAAKTPEEKMIRALQRAWQKMTPAARDVALSLSHGVREQSLLTRALSGSAGGDGRSSRLAESE